MGRIFTRTVIRCPVKRERATLDVTVTARVLWLDGNSTIRGFHRVQGLYKSG